MYRRPYGNKSSRSRGRGFPRGRRPAPYNRRDREDTDLTIPKPAPDSRLIGTTTTEQAIARAKDDARVARDWQTWFTKYFEREEYSLPRPAKTHLLPDQAEINERVDGILRDAKTKCREAINEHLQLQIEKAGERERNPPASAQDLQFQQWMERMERYQKTTIMNAIATMTRAAQEIHAPIPDEQNSGLEEK